jgi:hypothetical protein
MPLCLLHKLHDVIWARTRAAAVGCRRLTAWAMAWPIFLGFLPSFQANVGKIPRFRPNRFIPNPCQFIVHYSSHHSTLCNIDTAL